MPGRISEKMMEALCCFLKGRKAVWEDGLDAEEWAEFFRLSQHHQILPMVYDGPTLAIAFCSTAVVFACMAIIGHTTKMDLTKFAPYLFAGLIAILVTTLLNNLFFRSEGLYLGINYLGIIIFLGLIAYDMQNLRRIYLSGLNDYELSAKISIYGAFELYLDFINLFIRILSLMSRSNDN